jgi:16S rRNA (adenine1518-N6/adenine1519-N6)-dimethyltransferase
MWTYLWQNFLIDTKIRQYIADKISVLYKELWCDSLIEIWPGKWSISKLIQTISPNFFMIDKDPTFRDNWQLIIEHWSFVLSDVLDLDVETMLKEKKLDSKKTLVVGNLPYYITSPILRKFFGGKDFVWWIFMVQDEVGQKIKSDAKKKSYLRWLLNYWCTVTYLKWVPAKCFKPAPKVKSCLIQLGIKDTNPIFSFDALVEFLELFAPFSRKTLWAIQKMIQKKSELSFEIPSTLSSKRLEELSWNDLTVILGNKVWSL